MSSADPITPLRPDRRLAGGIDHRDVPMVLALVADTAREEPATVAEARALIADAGAGSRQVEAQRLLAWLVALEARRQARAVTPRTGGTAA